MNSRKPSNPFISPEIYKFRAKILRAPPRPQRLCVILSPPANSARDGTVIHFYESNLAYPTERREDHNAKTKTR